MDRGTERRLTVCVSLDDPAAAALSRRTYKQPTHLVQLLLFLSQAAADTLRDRHKLAGPVRSDPICTHRLNQGISSKHCSPTAPSGFGTA